MTEPTTPERFRRWEFDHTGLVHVLWGCGRDGLSLDANAKTNTGEDATDEIGHRIMQSRWFQAVRADAGAKAIRIAAELYRLGHPEIRVELLRLADSIEGNKVSV